MRATIFISSVQKELQEERQVDAGSKCATNEPIAPAAGQRIRGRPKDLHRRDASTMTQMPQRETRRKPAKPASAATGMQGDKKETKGTSDKRARKGANIQTPHKGLKGLSGEPATSPPPASYIGD